MSPFKSQTFFNSPIVIFIISSIVPLAIVLGDIYHGRIAFWFDPARDLLLGLHNLVSPTLIGQPSGIPGIFYGPYWIWLISLITLVSEDPRTVAFLLLTIPYFTIFPIFLYKISKQWGIFIFISLWLIFILNFTGYASQIWNVNYAPLFLSIAIYFGINSESYSNRKRMFYFFLTGLSIGLASNFHLSFGIPAILGFIVYFLINHMHMVETKKLSTTMSLYFFGVAFSFLPFFLFELRHNFIQTKIFLNALTNSVVYNTAVVGQTGMNDNEIFTYFFGRFSHLLGIRADFAMIFLILLLVVVVFRIILKKSQVSNIDRRLVVLILSISISLLLIFIFNRNPIWNYYFIGVEILFALFLGFAVHMLSIGKYVLIVFVCISLFARQNELRNLFTKNDFKVTDLGTQIHIVQTVFNDSETNFFYHAYNPAIYTYEYDYLFKWLGNNYSKKIVSDSPLVYLIIPKVNSSTEKDFINYKTSGQNYEQLNVIDFPDGTKVYKFKRTK